MMMIIGRVPFSQIGKLLGIVALVVGLAFMSIMCFGKDEKKLPEGKQKVETVQTDKGKEGESKGRNSGVLHRLDTWKSRIDKFIDNKDVKPEDVDIINDDAQRSHANIAIVSSGITGKGPGNSEERGTCRRRSPTLSMPSSLRRWACQAPSSCHCFTSSCSSGRAS